MRIAPSTNATGAATPAPGLGRVSLLHASFGLLSSRAIARCGRSSGVPHACGAKQFAIFLGTSAMGGWCAWLEYLRGVICVIRRVGRRHDVQHANICRREASARGDAACCNPVQHVATQCLQPSATNPVQHVATRSADERQRLVADRETFHTGECEMQHVRRARSGGRACIHGGVRSGTAAGGSPARG